MYIYYIHDNENTIHFQVILSHSAEYDTFASERHQVYIEKNITEYCRIKELFPLCCEYDPNVSYNFMMWKRCKGINCKLLQCWFWSMRSTYWMCLGSNCKRLATDYNWLRQGIARNHRKVMSQVLSGPGWSFGSVMTNVGREERLHHFQRLASDQTRYISHHLTKKWSKDTRQATNHLKLDIWHHSMGTRLVSQKSQLEQD